MLVHGVLTGIRWVCELIRIVVQGGFLRPSRVGRGHACLRLDDDAPVSVPVARPVSHPVAPPATRGAGIAFVSYSCCKPSQAVAIRRIAVHSNDEPVSA